MKRQLPYVFDTGTGNPPLVFLHSLAGTRFHWQQQVTHFARHHRVAAIDLLGHGDNPTPWTEGLSFQRVANDVLSTANHLGLGKFVLVGHSFGGGVAIACAATVPNQLVGLILADPIGDQRQAPQEETTAFKKAIQSEQYEETVRGFWQDILIEAQPATHDRVMEDLRGTPRETVVGGFAAMLAYDPVTPLQSYRGRVLSITTPGNDFPYSLHNLIPELPNETIHGVSHWLQMDRPEEFNQLIEKFVERRTGGR